jgi:hypothetical protein
VLTTTAPATPGEYTATAQLTKPDIEPLNDVATVTVAVLPTCASVLASGTSCPAGYQSIPERVDSVLNDTSEFIQTCCVSCDAGCKRTGCWMGGRACMQGKGGPVALRPAHASCLVVLPASCCGAMSRVAAALAAPADAV